MSRGPSLLELRTPGPWRVGDGGATVFGPKVGAELPTVIASLTRGLAGTETRGNAQLIAAAPDLLRALQSIVAWDVAGCDPSRTSLNAARELLDRIDRLCP